MLVLQSDAKLPVELAIERQHRAAHIHPATFDLSSLPQVRVPYRMWRTPALDFVVNAGVTHFSSVWLDALAAENGRLLVPLTNAERWGWFLMITRQTGDRYAARLAGRMTRSAVAR